MDRGVDCLNVSTLCSLCKIDNDRINHLFVCFFLATSMLCNMY